MGKFTKTIKPLLRSYFIRHYVVLKLNIFLKIISFHRAQFRRRSNALEGMAVASFLGISSGIYIWKPFFEEMQANRIQRESLEGISKK